VGEEEEEVGELRPYWVRVYLLGDTLWADISKSLPRYQFHVL
jgi:hypothetical protein